MPLTEYLGMLKVGGKFMLVGLPEEAFPPVPVTQLVFNNTFIGGSTIGSPSEISEMLDLAVSHKVKGWVETRPLNEANQAILDMEKGKARYRYCLVNEKNVAELSHSN
jgi:alcohol dehydrogenase (NADP+)